MRINKAVLTALGIVFMAILWAAPISANTGATDAALLTEYEALAKKADRAFQLAVKALDIQTDMPADNIPAPQGKPLQHKNPRPFLLSPIMAKIILIVAVAIILAIILYNLRNNLWSNSRTRKLAAKKEKLNAEIEPEATSMRMGHAQNQADELAAQGLYAEAMHVLLLQSVSELRLRLSVSIAVSLTSREILHRIGLAPQGHADFANIVSRVEISYFGYHEPGAEDYNACRQSYHSLTDVLRKGGAAT